METGKEAQNEAVKSQCIVMDDLGNINSSCDTLFEITSFGSDRTFMSFPFLRGVIRKLSRSNRQSEPVFIPDVDFHFDGFHSVCDFTFMRSTDARGISRIVWYIYDNSEHFRSVIEPGKKIRKRTAGILNITLL